MPRPGDHPAGASAVKPYLRQGFGMLVIAFAVATLFDYDTAITAWLSHFYPNGNIGL